IQRAAPRGSRWLSRSRARIRPYGSTPARDRAWREYEAANPRGARRSPAREYRSKQLRPARRELTGPSSSNRRPVRAGDRPATVRRWPRPRGGARSSDGLSRAGAERVAARGEPRRLAPMRPEYPAAPREHSEPVRTKPGRLLPPIARPLLLRPAGGNARPSPAARSGRRDGRAARPVRRAG